MDFNSSETKHNLMRAFAGESQARNRYDYSGSKAKTQKLHVIEAVFKFTANQEREHAEVFFDYLKHFNGETIEIDGTYPVNVTDNIVELLRQATTNEFHEFEDAYPAFAQIAADEGFPQIANTFNMIAEIEKTHGERFNVYADLLEQGMLFVSNVSCEWMCLNCGHIHKGTEAPQMCPVCSHDQGYFIRLELAPYTTE